jgi:hypothetical protein
VDGERTTPGATAEATVGATAAASDDLTLAVVARALACAAFRDFTFADAHSVSTHSATRTIATSAASSFDRVAAVVSSFDIAALAASSLAFSTSIASTIARASIRSRSLDFQKGYAIQAHALLQHMWTGLWL